MKGGINAWEGLVAEGAPEAGMAYFSSAVRPEEMIGLGWLLEEGSRKFYSEIAGTLRDPEGAALLQELERAEMNHQSSLLKLYKDIPGVTPDSRFPAALISKGPSGDIVEGGIPLQDALEWAKGKNLKEILEFSISLESSAYDLYLKMERKMESQNAKKVFKVLSSEEKQHLEQLASLLEKKI